MIRYRKVKPRRLDSVLQALSIFYRRAFVIVLILMVLVRDVPPANDVIAQVSARVGSLQFDFIGWTLDALGLKGSQTASNEQSYMQADQRKAMVDEYFDLLAQSLDLERQIDRVFADPEQTDPNAASLDLKTQLSQARARMNQIAPIAEAVMQEQISVILAEQGFGTGGQILPPVEFHITALPGFLIVSPRDRIELQTYANIEPGLNAADETALEDRIEKDLNVSALIAPLGGLGTYPTMIYETSNLNYTMEVGAHEWAHNYLTLRPLGIIYESAPRLRTMNEVTATLFGQEIGRLVIARYYPERLPPPPAPRPTPDPNATPTPEPTRDPNAFDFNTEMHETRVTVDALLAEGKIEEAEAYMEARRQMFVERGYQIRKLNQAYFAFYGAYNTGPGAGGQDPVGPAVLALRDQSPSLKAFLDTMSWMTSFEELQAAVGE
jgi:hypothetical protein